MEKKTRISNVFVNEDERYAVDVITLRKGLASGDETLEDYIPDAARCLVKTILSQINKEIDLHTAVLGDGRKVQEIEVKFVQYSEETGDNVYHHGIYFEWKNLSRDEGDTYKPDEYDGFILQYKRTYFYDKLVEQIQEAFSETLGKPTVEETENKKAHIWNYEVE